MPNHIHGIIKICNKNHDKNIHGLSEFVRAFKSFSSRRVHENVQTFKSKVWQPRFYDHVIRDDSEIARIRNYIADNPKNWIIDNNYII